MIIGMSILTRLMIPIIIALVMMVAVRIMMIITLIRVVYLVISLGKLMILI